MDTNIIITVILVVAIIAAFLMYQRAKIRLKGPLGTEFSADASNPPGVRMKDITSRQGGIRAADETGRGADAEKLNAHQDISVTSAPPKKDFNPKA